MSYLLDALRKADKERGASGVQPASPAVHYEAPEKRSNWWWLIALLLLVNFVAAGYLLFGDSVSDGIQVVAVVPSPTALIASPESMPVAKSSPTAALAPVPTVEPAAAPEALEAIAQPVPTPKPTPKPVAPASRTALPIPAAPVAGPQSALVPALPPVRVAATAAPKPVVRASTPAPRKPAATKKPAVPVAPIPAPMPVAPVNALPQLPFLSQLPETVRSELPRMSIRAIVDHAVPAKRFVLINAGKYREGDAMAPGLALEQVTAQGVVMNYKGDRFILLVN